MTTDESLGMLKDAVEAVAPNYIKLDCEPADHGKKVMVERSFAYELYHQWSNLLSVYKNSMPQDRDLILNGEITKKIDLATTSFPDIVLHGGQGNTDKQILVVEIKRKSENYPSIDDIYKDLDKLGKYLNLKIETIIGEPDIDASYKNACFILANCTDEKLKGMIISVLSKCDNSHPIHSLKSRITCISAEISDDNKKTIVKSFKLSDIS